MNEILWDEIRSIDDRLHALRMSHGSGAMKVRARLAERKRRLLMELGYRPTCQYFSELYNCSLVADWGDQACEGCERWKEGDK